MPPVDQIVDSLGNAAVHPLPISHDCVDGFLGAYWRRPHAYLDEQVRRAISSFAKIPDVAPGITRLQRDLADGTWVSRHGDLLEMDELDMGYCLVVADTSSVE